MGALFGFCLTKCFLMKRRVVMQDKILQKSYRRQVVLAIGLALAAGSLFGVDAVAQERGGGTGARLNTIIENAEQGKLNFNGESWQMMPDNEHNIFGVIALQGAMAENRPEGSDRFLLPPVVRINMEANHCNVNRIKVKRR